MDSQEVFSLGGTALNQAVAVHVMGLRERADFGEWPEHEWSAENDHYCREYCPGGRECKRCDELDCGCHGQEPEPLCVVESPTYSTGIPAIDKFANRSMFKIIDRLHTLGWDVELRLPCARAGGLPQCMVDANYPDAPNLVRVLMGGKTIAEAVCRAALYAVLENPA